MSARREPRRLGDVVPPVECESEAEAVVLARAMSIRAPDVEHVVMTNDSEWIVMLWSAAEKLIRDGSAARDGWRPLRCYESGLRVDRTRGRT